MEIKIKAPQYIVVRKYWDTMLYRLSDPDERHFEGLPIADRDFLRGLFIDAATIDNRWNPSDDQWKKLVLIWDTVFPREQ